MEKIPTEIFEKILSYLNNEPIIRRLSYTVQWKNEKIRKQHLRIMSLQSELELMRTRFNVLWDAFNGQDTIQVDRRLSFDSDDSDRTVIYLSDDDEDMGQVSV